MKVSRWRLITVSILCIFPSPFAVAEEILVAKVYRDYPGYIESPTCTNPRLDSSYVRPLGRVAVRGPQDEAVAVAEPVASRRADKVYRDYPGYIEVPTCINPRMAPTYAAQPAAEEPAAEELAAEELAAEELAAEELAAEELAAEELAAEELAAEKLAAEKLAAEKLAAEKLAAEKLAAEELVAEKLAAEKLAAEKVAAEKVAAEKLAAEKVAAEKLAADKLAADKLAADKLAADKLAADKLAADKLAADKLAAEKPAAKKLAAEKLAAEKLAAEKHNEPVVSQDAASILSDVRIAPGQVVLESNGRVAKYRYFTMNNPPRLVVDIYELEPSFKERSFSASDGFNNIRIGTHSDKIRLVFDAHGAELPQYSVERNATDIRISWNKAKVAEEITVVTAEKLAAEKLAAEKLAAEKLAAEKLAAEKLAAEKLAAEKPAVYPVLQGKEEIRLSPRFPSFVATLQEADLSVLEQLVEQLKGQQLIRIDVIGHADNLPIVERSRHIFADNMALSQARARNVAEYLQQRLGIPSEAISLRGLGDSIPVADNKTEAGRALNRRVEVFMVVEPIETIARLDPVINK